METKRSTKPLRIGVLGTGSMAAALGGAFVRAGHQVLVGGRDADKARKLSATIGATGGGALVDAARFGEVVLLALPAGAAEAVVASLAGELDGATLLDCTVPMAPGEAGPVLTTDGGGDSMARRLASAAAGARVVKAFGICHESIWTVPAPAFEGAALGVPYCTDDPVAAALACELVASMGCAPVPCGGLERAGLLEAAAVFAIGVWWSGGEARHVFPSPALAPGAMDDEE